MALNYQGSDGIVERLKIAHDPNQAKVRAYFFEKENEFFRRNINNQIVLVAGSGLGHDSFELAKYNKRVIGVEFDETLIQIAEKRAKELGLQNIEFRKEDITSLNYSTNDFNSAVLNMGTISNFDNKEGVIKSLLRVSQTVYLDFYPPIPKGLKIRKKMYEEEKWNNVQIKDTAIISEDGLESVSITEKKMTEIVSSIDAKVKYYSLCEFAVIAKITGNEKY